MKVRSIVLASSAGLFVALVGSMGIGRTQESPNYDSDILSAMRVNNDSQIAAGHQAVEAGNSSDIRRYGQNMVRRYTDLNLKLNQLAQDNNIPLSGGKITSQFKSEAGRESSALSGLRGSDFDKAYIDEQVKGHETAISMLDANGGSTTIAPLLKETRSTMKSDLRHARNIQQHAL